MSSNFRDWLIDFDLPRLPIIHAGAHFAEERFDYAELECEPVYWIEALLSNFQICEEFLISFENQHAINAAISNSPGQIVTFYEAGAEASSSSILKPHLITASHPEVQIEATTSIQTTTLDLLLSGGKFGIHSKYGLVLDVQGAEKLALMGARNLLKQVAYVISEVSTRELYKDGVSLKELTKFMKSAGFDLCAYDLNRTTGWGEALFVRLVDVGCSRTSNLKPVAKISGSFSLGTSLRTLLTRAKFPTSFINKIKR